MTWLFILFFQGAHSASCDKLESEMRQSFDTLTRSSQTQERLLNDLKLGTTAVSSNISLLILSNDKLLHNWNKRELEGNKTIRVDIFVSLDMIRITLLRRCHQQLRRSVFLSFNCETFCSSISSLIFSEWWFFSYSIIDMFFSRTGI